MTIWDFITRLSSAVKIIILTLVSLFCVISVYFYKYVPDLKDLTWYFIVAMMLFIVVVYYGLFVAWSWICLHVMDWEKDIDTLQSKLTVFGINAFIEAAIFAAVAYLWIDSSKTFWMWFFGLQLYRLVILGTIRIFQVSK